MKTFHIAIAGCGKVAHLHAQAIANIQNARLTAVWSRTHDTAVTFAGQYKTEAFDDIGLMVRKKNIDLVIVCTPHPFHKDPAVEAAHAGASVLIEKPLASTLADSDEIIRACRDAAVKLGVVGQRRFSEPAQRVKKAIDEGKIGKPVLGEVTILGWRDKAYYDSDEWRGTWGLEGGGVMVNQAPHQLDILMWYMGDIEEVYGIWKNLNHPYIEVEDTALAIVKFKNGGLGNILVSNSQKPGIYGKVHVHGENGATLGVQTDGGAMFIAGMIPMAEPPVLDLWTVPGEEKMLKVWNEEDIALFGNSDPNSIYMQRQIEDFIDALENDREPMINGEEGRKTVELFTAIYRSTRDNKPIRFPLEPESGRADMDGRLSL